MICRKCTAEVPDAPFCCQCGASQAETPPKKTKRGNGQGRVWKRGKTWYCQVTAYLYVTDDKKVHQKRRTKGGFRTKKEALDYIPVLRGRRDKEAPTLLELYTQWERNEQEKLSESRRRAYKKARERIEPIINRRIDTLTVSELQEIVDAAPKSHAREHIKTLLSVLLEKGVPDGFIHTNLAKYIDLPELEQKERQPFEDYEVQKFWSAFASGNHFAGYILLMIYTGMMPGELLKCKVEMIDLDHREIRGCGLKTDIRKESPIVFPEFLVPIVESLIDGATDGYLTPMRSVDSFRNHYYAAIEEIGVRKLPPYSCRHTTGTAAARVNLSAPVIQRIMRHARITTSQNYIHLNTDDAHEGINKLKMA